MSKRISIKEAKRKRDYEIESQRLNKKGIKPKISRAERKRRKKLTKYQRFMEMLKDRGGHVEQKEFDENAGKDIVN